jgi:hypothetical protein
MTTLILCALIALALILALAALFVLASFVGLFIDRGMPADVDEGRAFGGDE